MREVKEALSCGVDTIMLDNMTNDAMKKAVDFVASRALLEASGNVNLNRVAEIAATGVDLISNRRTHPLRPRRGYFTEGSKFKVQSSRLTVTQFILMS